MRRSAPVLTSAVLLVLLLGWYLAYTRRIITELRREASRSGRMYAQVFVALGQTKDDASTAALLDVSQHIREMGVPLILTDVAGRPTASANLPFEEPVESPRTYEYVKVLDAQNPPVSELSTGTTVHFGNTPLVSGLQVIPLVQATTLAVVLVFALYAIRTGARADRERIWAGMARESAHQLGTPLSSLGGWVELLGEREGDEVVQTALRHMATDLERLGRVAHRFERIGRPPRRDPVDVGELAERVAAYFRARVPTLAYPITVAAVRAPGPLVVRGDAVLLEWALEALAKNAIDALAGRGGTLEISAERLADSAVRLRVSDDGPGIPREMRSRVFEAGFSTKETGWGIGLSLARRIIHENHGGRLVLVPSDRGATFDIILR